MTDFMDEGGEAVLIPLYTRGVPNGIGAGCVFLSFTGITDATDDKIA